MGGAQLLLALAAVTVDYGWQRDGDGLQYIVQIPAEQLRQAGEVESVIDPRAQGLVTSVVVRVGDEPLPRDDDGLFEEAEAAKVAAAKEDAGADLAPVPVPALRELAETPLAIRSPTLSQRPDADSRRPEAEEQTVRGQSEDDRDDRFSMPFGTGGEPSQGRDSAAPNEPADHDPVRRSSFDEEDSSNDRDPPSAYPTDNWRTDPPSRRGPMPSTSPEHESDPRDQETRDEETPRERQQADRREPDAPERQRQTDAHSAPQSRSDSERQPASRPERDADESPPAGYGSPHNTGSSNRTPSRSDTDSRDDQSSRNDQYARNDPSSRTDPYSRDRDDPRRPASDDRDWFRNFGNAPDADTREDRPYDRHADAADTHRYGNPPASREYDQYGAAPRPASRHPGGDAARQPYDRRDSYGDSRAPGAPQSNRGGYGGAPAPYTAQPPAGRLAQNAAAGAPNQPPANDPPSAQLTGAQAAASPANPEASPSDDRLANRRQNGFPDREEELEEAAGGGRQPFNQKVLNGFLLISLVVNAYLGIIISKLYHRYRGLVASVRGIPAA